MSVLSSKSVGLMPRSAAVATAEPVEHASRILGLDGIRALAVLSVMATHYGIMPSGFFGVDIFFVLSGFLITTLLLREHDRHGDISIRLFYARRSLRILPIMLLLVLIVYVTDARYSKDAVDNFNEAIAAVFFYLNWVHAFGGGVSCLTQMWSLSVEEQFYLVWPAILVLCLARRNAGRWIGAVLLAGVIVPEVERTLLWPGSWTNIHYYRTDMRLDSLAWGALMAFAVRGTLFRRVITRCGHFLGTIALGTLVYHLTSLGSPWSSYYLAYGAYAAVAVSSAFLIATVVVAKPAWLLTVLEFGPIRWIGTISYGLYLTHTLVMKWSPVWISEISGWIQLVISPLSVSAASSVRWATEQTLQSMQAILIIDFFLAFPVAALSFYIWETPFLRLRKRFQRSERAFVATQDH